MLLAEELLPLGLDPEHGTVADGARRRLVVGPAGAPVLELALDGAVQAGRRIAAATAVVAATTASS